VRDLALTIIILGGCLMTLRRPWIGVILWTWVSIMTPHTQTYGFANSMPVALMVAVATFIGLAVTKDRRKPFLDPAVTMLVVFMAWVIIGWPFSHDPAGSKEMLSKVLKIDLMIIVSIMLLLTKQQIQYFVWINVFSIGYYGVKGGIFTLKTGGGNRVWGPGGFIGGNNEVALAFIVAIPLMYYIFIVAPKERKWLRRGLLAAMALTAAAALGSHSRGALLGISAMAVFLWWRSDKKLVAGILMSAVAVLLIAFMPSNWSDRMGTIENYEKDGSAMGRINAWWMAFNLANDLKLFGGGFEIYLPAVFAKYAPDPTDIHAAHSIYFQVLGEHGWLGLLFWLAIWWFTWRTASWLRVAGRAREETKWCADLGAMCQVSLVGYCVGGAFLSLAYFDLPYNIMVMVVVTKAWMNGLNDSKVTSPIQRSSGSGPPGFRVGSSPR
jgi:putative inorganic carbon (hco3(-)) transporter